MYKTNFYGQETYSYGFISYHGLPGEHHIRLPRSQPNLSGDIFTRNTSSSFENKLYTELNKIKAMESMLEKRRAQASDRSSPELKQELSQSYASLARAKKLIALLVEHMSKSLQNISANFR